jgi:Uma2 family endonuclease
MSVALREPMTLAEFLDWEERQELRYEFDGFQPVAMTGGTIRHEVIGYRLRGLLLDRLAGKRCRPYGPTTKIEVQGRIRYPDAYVSCTPADPGATIVPEPVVVFEVLSPTTSRTDRIEKLREYQTTPSIQRYVIFEQDAMAATVYSRRGMDWTVRVLAGDESLDMPEIDVTLGLPEVYADVEFEEETEQRSEPPGSRTESSGPR